MKRWLGKRSKYRVRPVNRWRWQPKMFFRRRCRRAWWRWRTQRRARSTFRGRQTATADLAAYVVYRRDIKQNEPGQRIASVGLETSYRDTNAQPEHSYAYSLSAVDQSGNESQHSAEVEETLPSK